VYIISALEHTSHLSNGYRGSFLGVKTWGVKLIHHLYLLQRLGIRGAIPLLPPKSSWHDTLFIPGTTLPLCRF